MLSLEALVTKSASVLGIGLCRFRGHASLDAFERVVDRFHRRLNNTDFVMQRNGELRALEIVAAHGARCIFDVGANVGDWSATAARLLPGCAIHAFEIVPSTFRELASRLGSVPNVHLNLLGLSDTDGDVRIHLGRDSGTATACRIEGMRFHEEWYRGEITGHTARAADYLAETGVGGIDYLKIDVEGMDLRVIKGFGERIEGVRALQFEYGIFNIASHDLLSDFYRYLNERGFVVGKIFPGRVVFSGYHFNMENFHGSNYLAVRQDQRELIEDLARGRAERSRRPRTTWLPSPGA